MVSDIIFLNKGSEIHLNVAAKKNSIVVFEYGNSTLGHFLLTRAGYLAEGDATIHTW